MPAVDLIFIISILIGLVYGLVSLVILAFERYRSARQPIHTGPWPPVTVFKPLKGLDDQLEENLRSFFNQDYPEFQLLFAVSDGDDAAVEVVRRLRQQHPHVHSSLVVDSRRTGFNPKVNNMINMQPYARHDVFVISDSNVRVGPDYLRDLVGHLEQESNVGIVTSTIRGCCARNLGAILENLHLNTFVAGSVFAIKRLFNINITIGKSMCFRRESLRQWGGFAGFANYLAEDHLMGVAAKRLKQKVRFSSYCVDSINQSWTMKRFFNRHLRWAMMRRRLSLVNYISEFWSNSILLALLYLAWRPDVTGLGVLGGTLVLRLTTDLAAARLIRATQALLHYLLIPFKELVISFIWFIPFFSRAIDWRGNRMRITDDTELRPAADRSLRDYVPSLRPVTSFVRKTSRRTADRTKRLMSRLSRTS
jgi:ceramide glucosyltransferase